ncbi:MAG TPA: energy transducer TonB [Candidatus Acidoferrales bacterium]|nr:energy transducer TonB [Candidatus Acidoferrales bacterium]
MRSNLLRVMRTLAVLALVSGAARAQELKKVSKSEGLNNATTKVQPDYPSMARQLKIEGPVELEAVVTESGAVEKVNIVSGNPLLTRPAAEAVRKWKFAPFTAEGKAIKALVPVSMSFKL